MASFSNLQAILQQQQKVDFFTFIEGGRIDTKKNLKSKTAWSNWKPHKLINLIKIIVKLASFSNLQATLQEKSPFFTLVEGGRVDTKIN